MLTSLKKRKELFFLSKLQVITYPGEKFLRSGEFFHKSWGLSLPLSFSETVTGLDGVHAVQTGLTAIVGLGRDGLHAVGVPDDQVSIGPHSNAALPEYRLKTLAALVLVTATNWFSSIFPVTEEDNTHACKKNKLKCEGVEHYLAIKRDALDIKGALC